MPERKGAVTFKGSPLTLVGRELKLGDRAPDFTCVANDLSPATLATFKGKTLLVTSVPSLDTKVCDLETHRFNEEAAKLGDNVRVLTISMDLPFAQARWCGAAGVQNVRTLSDHRDASFGTAFGLLIKEFRLLARAVLILDREGMVRYVQVVKEASREPDYDDALRALAQVP